MRIGLAAVVLAMVGCVGAARAQTTQPAGESAPATQGDARAAGERKSLPADAILNQMLRPNDAVDRPLRPVDAGGTDATSGSGAVAPAAPAVPLMREGTTIVDRVGRLTRGTEANTKEIRFESDGKTLRDPPMILLPNSLLGQMEDAVKSSTRDLRFRVTGLVTEYKGRNYLLVEKVVVVPDVAQQVR